MAGVGVVVREMYLFLKDVGEMEYGEPGWPVTAVSHNQSSSGMYPPHRRVERLVPDVVKGSGSPLCALV